MLFSVAMTILPEVLLPNISIFVTLKKLKMNSYSGHLLFYDYKGHTEKCQCFHKCINSTLFQTPLPSKSVQTNIFGFQNKVSHSTFIVQQLIVMLNLLLFFV